MAGFNSDPYLYPGTQTLKNKLDIRDPAALERAQDDLAAQRYAAIAANLPKGPFTFDTLKDLHRRLFQDVYEWAGEPRTIGIGKPDWDGPGSKMTWFADPKTIPAMSRIAFNIIDEGRAVTGVDRASFVHRAAEFLNDLNIIHPFREGNGRAQRLLLTAIGEAAGHPISFEIVTRERMVSTSIAAHQGDLGGFARLLEEATDPRRVAALSKAIGFLKGQNASWWNDTYIAATRPGQTYSGALVGQAGDDFMMRVSSKARDWIAIGDAADLPRGAKSGQRIEFTATHFSSSASQPAAAASPGPAGNTPDTQPRRSGPSAGF